MATEAVCKNCHAELRRRSRWGGWWVHPDGSELCADRATVIEPVCGSCDLPLTGPVEDRCACDLL